MKLKIKLVIFLVLVMLLISTFKSTYAKYASTATGTANAQVANWQIKLDNKDIDNTTEYSQWQTNYTNITLNSFDNDNVADGKIAPGSSGKATIIIDTTKVDVSFNMSISAEIVNSSNANLIVSGVYVSTSLDNSTYTTRRIIPSNPLTFLINNVDSTGHMIFTYGAVETQKCTYIKIEVEYLWNPSSTDASDTTKGHDAAITSGGKSVQLKTTLGFTQKTS